MASVFKFLPLYFEQNAKNWVIIVYFSHKNDFMFSSWCCNWASSCQITGCYRQVSSFDQQFTEKSLWQCVYKMEQGNLVWGYNILNVTKVNTIVTKKCTKTLLAFIYGPFWLVYCFSPSLAFIQTFALNYWKWD